MKNIMLALILLVLTGCGTVRMVRGEVADRSADAADQSLETAIWGVCEGATIGALRRKYSREELLEILDRCPDI